MSTRMTETDWAVALEVFRASLPRRGAKGRNDRLFLEALHYASAQELGAPQSTTAPNWTLSLFC